MKHAMSGAKRMLSSALKIFAVTAPLEVAGLFPKVSSMGAPNAMPSAAVTMNQTIPTAMLNRTRRPKTRQKAPLVRCQERRSGLSPLPVSRARVAR